MVQHHLTAKVILEQIRTSPGRYSLTSNSLIRLHDAGVPDSVIAAMQAKQNGTSSDQGPATSQKNIRGGGSPDSDLSTGWTTKDWIDPDGTFVHVAQRIVHASPRGNFDVRLGHINIVNNVLYITRMPDTKPLSRECKNTQLSIDQHEFSKLQLPCSGNEDGMSILLDGVNLMGMETAINRAVLSDFVDGSSISLTLIAADATSSTLTFSLKDPALMAYEKSYGLLPTPVAPQPESPPAPQHSRYYVEPKHEVPKTFSGPTRLGLPSGLWLTVSGVWYNPSVPGLMSAVLAEPAELSALDNTTPPSKPLVLRVGTPIYLRCSVSPGEYGEIKYSLGLDHGNVDHKDFPLKSITLVLPEGADLSQPQPPAGGEPCTKLLQPFVALRSKYQFQLTSDAQTPTP